MKLKVTSPIGIVLREEIQKIDFEALDGYYTLLPRHQDFVTAMPPTHRLAVKRARTIMRAAFATLI